MRNHQFHILPSVRFAAFCLFAALTVTGAMVLMIRSFGPLVVASATYPEKPTDITTDFASTIGAAEL